MVMISQIRVELYGDGLDVNSDKQLSILHCVPLFHVTGSHVGSLCQFLLAERLL